MHPSSPFSVTLDQMFGSTHLAHLVWIISSCEVATSKSLCARINMQLISLSIHGIESFFGSLVNVIHIKCCYACMKSAMEVKICELIVH